MLRLAIPVVAAEVGWTTMGLVDTLMVGGLGKEAIAAVGLGNVLFFSVAVFGIGILLGMDTLVSQGFGAGDIEECHRSLVQGIYLAVAVTIPLCVLLAAAPPLLRRAPIDPQVLDLTIPYIRILNLGLPPLLVFFAIRRYLQGMNLAGPVLVALIVANLANWGGNWLLVRGRLGFPALGVRGSGWATVGSRFAMLGFGVLYVAWHARTRKTGLFGISWRPEKARLRRLLALGLPSAGQITLEVMVFGVASFLAGTIGPTALAAHEVVLQVAGTTFMVPLGISSAAAVRVGQALGRGDPAGSGRSGWTAVAIGAGFMSVSGLVMATAPGALVGVFTGDAGVIATARSLILAAAVFQVFDGVQIVSAGALRGAGVTKTPMYVMLFAHWGLGLPVGYLLAIPGRFGIVGIWIGLTTGLVVAGVLLVVAWKRQVVLIRKGAVRVDAGEEAIP